MAKKKVSGGLGEGSPIRIKPGVTSPEFPEVSIAGWTGSVSEIAGKPPTQKVIVEWDDATLKILPPDYVAKCEADQLYFKAACLSADDVELIS